MQAEFIKKAIAESVDLVKGVQDSELRKSAFHIVFSHLLGNPDTESASQVVKKKTKQSDKQMPGGGESTLPGRISALKNDDFFVVQRGIGEVREELKKRGWHHPVTSLSGPLQSLVRQKVLRREQLKDGNKKPWKYSNY